MSHSHFIRKNIISACTDTLDSIYRQRIEKLEKVEAELKAFEKELDDRSWWRKMSACNIRDGFARARLTESIRTNGDWYKDHEKRLKVMLSFCIALKDTTISISAQEFWDFRKFYKG